MAGPFIREAGFSRIRGEEIVNGLIIRTEKDTRVPEACVNGLDGRDGNWLRFQQQPFSRYVSSSRAKGNSRGNEELFVERIS